MELITYEPKKLIRTDQLWEPVLLVPTGDWQLGADGFWEEGLREYLRDCVREANGSPILMLGMGDYADMLSPSNRRKVANAGLYDRTLDALASEAKRDKDRILALIRKEIPEGEWIGMVEGHHYFPFDDGTTTDTQLCQELGTTFLGDCAVIHIKFTLNYSTTKTVKLWVHHGEGSATPMNKLAKIAAEWEGIDMFLMGHTPHIEAKVKGRIYTTDAGTVKHRYVRLVGTGGWLRGYTQGSRKDGRAQGNYVEQGMLPPCPLGGVKVWMKPWKNKDGAGVKLEVVV